jgi:hypothetical protein
MPRLTFDLEFAAGGGRARTIGPVRPRVGTRTYHRIASGPNASRRRRFGATSLSATRWLQVPGAGMNT